MKLLILTNNPERASFRQRIGAYLELMQTRGIRPSVKVLDKSLLKRIRFYRTLDQYDVIWLHKKCLNFSDGLAFRPRKARVLFNFDDAVMFNDKGITTPTHTSRFRRSLRKADAVLVGSSFLAEQARPHHTRITILPVGLNMQDYHSEGPKPNDGKIRLVWIGSAATLEYIRQLTPVLRHLAGTYPNLVLRLICDEFPEVEDVVVEKIHWSPQARSSRIGDCDIGLAPLPDTPFTRGKCSFKVLEYSASGIPVVASPVGTNPDHVQEGRTGFLVNTPEEWIEKLCLLIDDSSRRMEMGRQGRRFAQEFDVSVVGNKLCDLLFQVAGL